MSGQIIDPNKPDAKPERGPLDLDALLFRLERYHADDADDGADILAEDVPAMLDALKKLQIRERNLVMILGVKDMEIEAMRQCIVQGRDAILEFMTMVESRDNSNFKRVAEGLFRMGGIFNVALNRETDHELDEAAVKGKSGSTVRLVK